MISDCSGQATDPPTLSGAQEIAVSPPIGVHAKGLAGMFNMQTQDETEWCWAAVAVSINAYLDPPAGDGGPTWTQPSLATQVLAQELQWNPAVDCSADPSEECDRPAGLNDALSITGNLMPDGYRSNCFLDFASLQSWMDQQLPVGARILWPGGGAHFIALSGYQVFASGEQKVVVQDPLYGPSVQDYSSLRGQYISHGIWNDTYLVNVGDLMQHWSGGQYVSTPHRVVLTERPRQSIVFFKLTNEDEMVQFGNKQMDALMGRDQPAAL